MLFHLHTHRSIFRKGLAIWLLIAACGLSGLSASAPATAPLELPKAGKKAVFSLLTADPGKKVWSHYGHTGIRYVDPENQTDVVFNYGLFDFSSPNFISRFVKGETDYMVGTTSFFNFMLEYQIENRTVTEQVLNLTTAEKDRLLGALLTNIQPENRCYRYNFFYKNCSTMPRDLIEQAIDGRVEYSFEAPFSSLRQEIHHFTNAYPWTQFGIDLAVGAPADQKASLKDQQFAPDVLMHSFSTAFIQSDSVTRPLVLSTTEIYRMDPNAEEPTPNPPGPLTVLWMVCVLTLALTVWEMKLRPQSRLKALMHTWDGLLFGACGLVGLLMYFLMFFSEHPAVGVNYLAIWLHPLHLLFAFALAFRPFRNKAAVVYKAVNVPFQLFALAGLLFLPQAVHPAAIPLLLSVLIRSLQGCWVVYQNRNRRA